MIKSHLFEQAQPVEDETQTKWGTMRSIIEGMDNKGDEPLLTYLHHASIVFGGPVVEDDIFEMMEEKISGHVEALRFLEMLASNAINYAAILTPSDGKWNGYGDSVRTYIKNISHELKMVVVRPLMMAVADRFDPKKTEKTYRAIESWVVRFVIAGGHTTSLANRTLGDAAHKVSTREIRSLNGIYDLLKNVIPSDARFHAAFCTKTMKSEKLCRWFLRELETQNRVGTRNALLQAVSTTREACLEHILPRNTAATAGWSHFNADERKYYRYRLGNMILMNPVDNSTMGDKAFDVKRPVIEQSQNLLLTRDVVDRTSADCSWTKQHIDDRQKMMADLALARWPLLPS
jgi:hypothetical protein